MERSSILNMKYRGHKAETPRPDQHHTTEPTSHRPMNLQPRFHLLTIVFFVVFAIPSWMAVRALAEGIMEQWAVRYAEKQVLYDKGRTLQPILREVALSRQLASSQPIQLQSSSGSVAA